MCRERFISASFEKLNWQQVMQSNEAVKKMAYQAQNHQQSWPTSI
jgi:hypothetical protein